jgi:hypothetical protein
MQIGLTGNSKLQASAHTQDLRSTEIAQEDISKELEHEIPAERHPSTIPDPADFHLLPPFPPATGARHAPMLLLNIRKADIHSGSLGGHSCIVFTAFLGFRANLASACRNSPLVHFAPRKP